MPTGVYKHKKGKESPLYKIPRSKEVRDKISKINKGKHLNPKTEFVKGNIPWNRKNHKQLNTGRTHFKKGFTSWNKNIRVYPNRHHINLDRYNNSKSNLLYLALSDHRRLHARSYDFLVQKGLIKEYIKWFKMTYKPKLYSKQEYINILTKVVNN